MIFSMPRSRRPRRLCAAALALLLAVASAPGWATSSPFTAAAIEFDPALHERAANVDALYKAVERALEHGARLVVTPEMSTTGYLYDSRADIAPYVDTIPGKTTARLGELAAAYDAYLVVGMPERDARTDVYYNAAALIGPDGVIGKYRKLHQWEAEEHWAAWGNLGVPVYDTPLGRIAINICMDSGYGESARLAALDGADILAFPTNSSIQAIYYNQARALQNGLYIVEANRNDTEKDFHMVGMSAIWGPDGDKLAAAPYVGKNDPSPKAPRIVYAEIDPERYDTRKARLAGRRPELYQPLMLHIAPWNYDIDDTPHEVNALALQYTPVIGDKQANLAKVHQQLDAASDSDLVVLPEYALTGEARKPDTALMRQWAEPLDGPTSQQMAALARAHRTNIVYTQIESAGDGLYVTAVVVGRDGKRLGHYRKTHLSDAELAWAHAGDRIDTVDVPDIGRLGILLGEDARYPEAAGVLEVARADVIAIPSSWTGDYGARVDVNQATVANPYPDNAMVTWDAVAFSAQAYTVVSNFTGGPWHYRGGSALYTLDPLYGLDQAQVQAAGAQAPLAAHFKTKQLDWWLNQQKMVDSRRTDYYTPLVISADAS